MNNSLVFDRDGWLDSSADDAETQTLARLRISVSGRLITRNASRRGGESSAISTSLLPLAEFTASNWWPLLYEPVRPNITDEFRVRHRLDSGMRGYAFPAVALWSGGDGTILADWASFDNPFAKISFLAPQPLESVQLDRNAVEISLMDLIETVLERTDGSAPELFGAWARVKDSIADPDEAAYCAAAGRLGLDPYDPDGMDFSELASGLSETLFNDISEIVEASDIAKASEWLREKEARLKIFPELDLQGFGIPALDNTADPAWAAGVDSARILRGKTGIENPRKAVGELLGGLISEGAEIGASGPEGISAIVQRLASGARVGIVARSARQRRFRACAAAYMAWTAQVGEERAATDAFTRRQQASRAFAAELLAPQQVLLERAPRHGFDGEDIEDLASEFICPYETVAWQSVRAGIPLRGVERAYGGRVNVLNAVPRTVA